MIKMWLPMLTQIAVIYLGLVGVFSVFFYISNKRQTRGKRLLEGTEGFKFTY